MNTYLKDQLPGRQFLAFIGLAIGFFLLNTALGSIFFKDIANVLTDKNPVVTPAALNTFKWAQLVGSVTIFILPAIAFGYFSSPKMMSYVGLNKHFSIILLVLSIVLLAVIQPFASWLGSVNAKINFGSMQKQLEEIEEQYTRVMQALLQMKTTGDLLINLLVMAFVPAVAEELFFRGSLQKVLLRMSNKPWLAVLLSSIIFALLHGTFFKILPIFLLGIMLGTVYHVTRNLWYNIIIHFLNNSLAILSIYYAGKSEILKKLNDDKLAVPILLALASAAAVAGVIYLMKRKSDEVLPAYVTDDDNELAA